VSQFDKVSVIKKSNVYFDGKCISHTVLFEDGSRKTIGVIFPSLLTFNTASPEVMDILGGHFRVRLEGETDWKDYMAGESFEGPGHSCFEIETMDLLDYVCHFTA